MFTIIGIMLFGILIGYLLRKIRLPWLNRGVMLLIWLLLFLLGIEVGGNEAIISGLFTIGVEAFAITIAAIVGSVGAAWALWVFVSKSKRTKL